MSLFTKGSYVIRKTFVFKKASDNNYYKNSNAEVFILVKKKFGRLELRRIKFWDEWIKNKISF